ncbi:MAG: PEPxxWA-CTERM sorting domain-containing protein [Polymorphobacter sp.]
MMMKSIIAVAAIAAVSVAAPAAAVTTIAYNFAGGANANLASLAITNSGITVTATGQTFATAPGLLTNISDLTTVNLRRTAPGIGVTGGSAAGQIDTNTAAREGMLITVSQFVSLSALTLNSIDNNDTLSVYGVGSGGALQLIGYGGTIKAGLAGAANFTNIAVNGGTTVLTFLSQSSSYKQFFFTTRTDGSATPAQSYRIENLTVAVPEPQTWALMIVGFGLVGVAARRKQAVVAA